MTIEKNNKVKVIVDNPYIPMGTICKVTAIMKGNGHSLYALNNNENQSFWFYDNEVEKVK